MVSYNKLLIQCNACISAARFGIVLHIANDDAIPSKKFLKKSVKGVTWDLASLSNFSVLLGTNFFWGRPGLACRAAHNCLVGTKKLLPAMCAVGYNFR